MEREPKSLEIYHNDHDLLVELRVIVSLMRDDLKEMKDGTNVSIADHERRLRALENSAERWFGKQTVIAGLLGAALALVAAYVSTGYVHF